MLDQTKTKGKKGQNKYLGSCIFYIVRNCEERLNIFIQNTLRTLLDVNCLVDLANGLREPTRK